MPIVGGLGIQTSPRPGLTWKPRHKPSSRSDGRTPSCPLTWAGCCARKATSTGPGRCSRPPCGRAAGTATTGSGPTPSLAWRAWPAMQDRTGIQLGKSDARHRQNSLDQARTHLGDEQLERAYAEGMALSLEEALDLALPRLDPA
jgi:hypothetical protein